MAEATRMDDRSPIVLAPVVTQNVTELIAEQIRERILSGEFKAGEVLPTEVELMRQTTMSRASVRSAIRILQTQGLIQTRPGRLGGAIVQSPGEDQLGATVNQLIRARRIGLEQLLEMQKAIEPQCAAIAARERTPEDLASIRTALDAIVDHHGDTASLLEAHSAWHVAVSRATRNDLLSSLMIALVHWIHTATEESKVLAGPVSAQVYQDITAAIERGESEAAGERMRVHVSSRAEGMIAELTGDSGPGALARDSA